VNPVAFWILIGLFVAVAAVTRLVMIV